MANLDHLPTFEAGCAALANQLEAVRAQVQLFNVNRWPVNTGAGWHPVYNTPADTPEFKPEGAKISQEEMNNLFAALGTLQAHLEGAGQALATIASYAPDLLDNS